MTKPISSVQIVSDGILVQFEDGMLTYFGYAFLRKYVGVESNQVFLDHNPCAQSEEDSRDFSRLQ